MKAIVIGGTGATGKELVAQLLEDNRFDAVTVLVRRNFFSQQAKLTEIVVDFEKLSDYKAYIQGDVAFSCLGTTLKDAGSKDAQWRVDHDYQLEFASIAKASGVESFLLLSAFGANAKSSLFYNKMKGSLEENIKKLNFTQLVILHPGGIERPDSDRKGEKAMIKLLKAFNAIGLFKRYEPLSTKRLAKAMIASYFKFKEKQKTVILKEIKEVSV
ncbi:NAD(P)H-binding protein [Sphingobacterium corticibacterium]|uniref:Semialdehyde dehydrogenase n=1 Tax=Sphingobacterium corticibacterium TaxID=2484746 RepID=A0A4Q6XXZ3_9SPHI|nr:NAD(P)H-binding protein [Sphingobacterium corticibacterium]RZF62304.1 semialdehyde dehydrogenase [Sphingobacterium corticibacterium]